jgi:hypothetical protein
MGMSDGMATEIARLREKHRVKKLCAFGSVVRDDFGQHRDIDMAEAFLRRRIAGSFDQYFDFKNDLEEGLGRSVDLVCAPAIRNSIFRREPEEAKRLIYAA